MPTDIDRNQVLSLVGAGAQLVEVLPSEEYEEEHLPGAINIPLRILTPMTTTQLERDCSVITYCYDYQ